MPAVRLGWLPSPDISVQVVTVALSLKPVSCDASKCKVSPVVTGGAAAADIPVPMSTATPAAQAGAKRCRGIVLDGDSLVF